MGFGASASDLLDVCVGSGGDCPEGITIGADAGSLRPLLLPPFSLPPFSLSPPVKTSDIPWA